MIERMMFILGSLITAGKVICGNSWIGVSRKKHVALTVSIFFRKVLTESYLTNLLKKSLLNIG